MTEEGWGRFIEHAIEMWVRPEIKSRADAGKLPEDFSWSKVLVLLPHDAPAIVRFGGEFSLEVAVRKTSDRPVQAGEHMYTWDIEKVVSAHPFQVDGRRVAFVFLQYIGPSWRVIFDFSPNGPEFKEPTEGEWSFSEAFAQVANEVLIQRIFEQTKSNEEQLRAIGLWAVPCLVPHPLNAVVHLVQDGHVEDARSTVVEHCSNEFLRERLGHWTGVQEFVDRATLFQEALEAHSRGWFHLSISACLPHVEGVITDWLHRMLPAGHDVKWRTESKARQFSDFLSNNAGGGVGYHAFSSVGDFISGGPVLSTFKTWTERIDTSFANRHVIGHGRYEASVYTKEASIKVFLLLDSMHWVISRLGPSGGDDAGQ